MLTLLNEIHFWSAQDDLFIKDTDYGAFKYYDRKDDVSTDNLQSKKSYADKRSYCWTLTNRRPSKLKDKLKEFEDQISQNKLVYYKWISSNILQMMLCTGLLINVYVNELTADIKKISFDKYLIGKLLTGCISDVIITSSHLLCTYNETKMTVVHFTKKQLNIREIPVKLSRLEPQLVVCDLAGPSGRRLERRICSSPSGDRLLVWWRCTRDDVYPWSPLVKDQDRANVHIYTLYGTKLELLCYRRTEFDPLDVVFDSRQSNLIHCVEQKISRRGVVSVEASTYEIVHNRLQQQFITSIPLQTHVSCHAFNPDGQKLVLGCIDGSVVLFDQSRGVTCVVKAVFIPTLVSWHPNGAILLVANERCQMQWFDLALSSIKSQTVSEDHTPANILDISSYFRKQPTLLHFAWNNSRCGNDSLLLLIFERGPLAVLRLLDGGGLSPDSLVAMYVRTGHIELALGMLLTLDWESDGTSCLAALHYIVTHLCRVRFTPNVEQQLQRALGVFYAPLRPLSAATRSDFGDQVADMTRRFFHILIRYRLYEKAFCLAIDVGDHDLFMDLYHCARQIQDSDMAVAALTRANELLERANSETEDSHSMCSRSECSQCDSDSGEDETQITQSALPPLPTVAVTYSTPSPLPPLPHRPRLTLPYKEISTNIPVVQTATKFGNTKPELINMRASLPERHNEIEPFPQHAFSNNLPFPKLNSMNANPIHVHRTVSMNIPPTPTVIPAPVKVNVPLNTLTSHVATSSEISVPSRSSGEKNVKFSDTVTAFIVPELPRSEKLSQLKNKRVASSQNRYFTDPKQELADSLPLCHPNDDYLKDFTPISNHSEDEESGTKIKVVHFGMV